MSEVFRLNAEVAASSITPITNDCTCLVCILDSNSKVTSYSKVIDSSDEILTI